MAVVAKVMQSFDPRIPNQRVIAIVDDSVLMIKCTAMALRFLHDIFVIGIKDSNQAVKALKGERFQCVVINRRNFRCRTVESEPQRIQLCILDFDMPDLSGLGVVKNIFGFNLNTRIMGYSTSYLDPKNQHERFDGYITGKPCYALGFKKALGLRKREEEKKSENQTFDEGGECCTRLLQRLQL